MLSTACPANCCAIFFYMPSCEMSYRQAIHFLKPTFSPTPGVQRDGRKFRAGYWLMWYMKVILLGSHWIE